MVFSTTYLQLNQPDSALIYAKEENIMVFRVTLSNIWLIYGIRWEVFILRKAWIRLALSYYKRSLDYAIAKET